MYPVDPKMLIQMIKQGQNPQQLMIAILQGQAYHTVTIAMETKKGDHLQEEDSRQESRSYKYIEAREMKKDKATQLRELEKYIQEMSQEIIDMISDASVEEKAYLEKKLTALGTKIGQMK